MSNNEFDLWIERFRPINNPLGDGIIFDTFGEALKIVKDKPERFLWTMVEDSESDKIFIVNGYHLVNRMGYLITEVPYYGEKGTLEINFE